MGVPRYYSYYFLSLIFKCLFQSLFFFPFYSLSLIPLFEHTICIAQDAEVLSLDTILDIPSYLIFSFHITIHVAHFLSISLQDMGAFIKYRIAHFANLRSWRYCRHWKLWYGPANFLISV